MNEPTALSMEADVSSGRRLVRAAKATALFELSRSLTGGRLAAGTVLALFPPSMTLLTLVATNYAVPHELVIGVMLFMVIT